jgi:hypothetical protein
MKTSRCMLGKVKNRTVAEEKRLRHRVPGEWDAAGEKGEEKAENRERKTPSHALVALDYLLI